MTTHKDGPTRTRVLLIGDRLCLDGSGSGYGHAFKDAIGDEVEVIAPLSEGCASDLLLSGLDEWLFREPDVAIVGMGFSDISIADKNSDGLAEYSAILEAIAHRLLESSCRHVFWIYPPTLMNDQVKAPDGSVYTNDTLRSVIQVQKEAVRTAGFKGVFLDQKLERWGIPTCWSRDGWHLSKRASKGIARSLYKQFAEWQRLDAAPEMFCNMCQPDFHQSILAGDRKAVEQPIAFEKCPSCGAAARIRSFAVVFDREILPRLRSGEIGSRAALTFAAIDCTRARIAPSFEELTSAALYGDYGKQTLRLDITNMQSVPDAAYSYIHACLILDYIEESEKALGECYRILDAPGGLLFHIARQRLINGDSPPELLHKNACRKATYYPGDHQVPSVRYSKGWLRKTMSRIGFMPTLFDEDEVFSKQPISWFLGVKA